jgi:hypothetical protein
VAKIFEITEIRARQIKLAKLKERLGELFHRVAIPLIDLPEENLDYILPALLMRNIDELNVVNWMIYSMATRVFHYKMMRFMFEPHQRSCLSRLAGKPLG